MAKTVSVGIAGFGMQGKHWAAVLSGMPEVQVAAIAEPRAERLEEAARQCACALFDGVEGMLKHTPTLDIFVCATHVPLHREQVVRVIEERRCHVICEKPIACTLQECDDMVEAAERAGVKLAIHHQGHFARAVSELKRKIAAGDIGELYLARGYGKGRFFMSDVMEIGGHLVELILDVVGGEPCEIYGDVTWQGRDVNIHDVVRVQDLYPEGRDSGFGAGDRGFARIKFAGSPVRAELHLTQLEGSPNTFNEERNYGYFVEFMGTAGRMELYLPRTLFFNPSPLGDLAKGATPSTEVNPDFRHDRDPVLTRLFMEDFLAAIKEGREPCVSGRVGRSVMEVTLGMASAALAGHPIKLPHVNRKHPFAQALPAMVSAQ